MKKKISVLLSACVICALALSACGSSKTTTSSTAAGSAKAAGSATAASTSTYKHSFTVTTPLADSHSAVKYINDAFKEISDKTGGRITGQVYASSQLASGQMATAMDMTVKGTIDMQCAGNSIYGPYIKDYELLGIPFLFQNHAAADKVLYNKDVYDYYSKKCEETNLHLMGYMENAWMVYTNNKHQMKVPSDLKGLKMRCGDGDLVEAAMMNQGASVVHMSLTDLYTSLQQGVVDGQDNGIAGAVVANKLYEVQKYITNVEFTYSPFVVVMNNNLWKQIPESDQKIMTDIFQKYMKEQVDYNRSLIEPNLQKIKDFGDDVYTPTADELKTWQAQMGADSDAVKKVLEKNYNQDFVKTLLSVAKDANSSASTTTTKAAASSAASSAKK